LLIARIGRDQWYFNKVDIAVKNLINGFNFVQDIIVLITTQPGFINK